MTQVEDGAGAPSTLSQSMIGAGGLSRVISDNPAAVLIVDLDDGRVIYANDLATQLAPGVTLPTDVATWSDVAGLHDESGAELEASATPLARVASGRPVTGEIVTALRSSDISEARENLWVIGTPLDDAPEPLGHRALVIFLPLRNEAAVRDAQASSADLRHRAVIASDLSFSISDPLSPDNPLVWVNPAFERLTGYQPSEVMGRNCRFLQGPLTDPATVQRISRQLAEGGSVAETLLNYRADGTAFWNHLVISPIFDADGTITHHVGVQSDVTDRVDADVARDAALALAQAATRRQRAVASVSAALSADLTDPAEIASRLPGLIAAHFAGWISVAMLNDEGSVDHVDVAFGTPGQAGSGVADAELDAARTFFRDYLAGPGAQLVDHVRQRSTQWPVDDTLTGETGDMWARAAAVWSDAVSTGAGSDDTGTAILAMPLRARDRAFGLLLVARPELRYLADQDERAALYDIALRAGTAMDNARLYAAEHDTALTLQRSLLPELPEIDGFDIAASYIPAATAEVGGDWFDVLELPGPWIGVAVGDVIGHDITAAAAMGQLRAMLRSFAWDGLAPDDLLRKLDHLARATHITPMATVFYARVDAPSAFGGASAITYSSAGHLPALLRHPDGQVEQLSGARTTPVGVRDPDAPTHSTTRFPPGSALVLYTDGLVEQRQVDVQSSIDALAAVLAGTGDETRAATIRDALIASRPTEPGPAGGDHADDTCVLVVTRPRLDEAVTAPPAATTADRHVWTLPADPTASAAARHRVHQVCGTLPRTTVEDLELVVAELVTNALQNADGPPHLAIEVHPDRVRVEVSDSNDLEPQAPPSTLDLVATSGRGLFIVDKIALGWGCAAPRPDIGRYAKTVWANVAIS